MQQFSTQAEMRQKKYMGMHVEYVVGDVVAMNPFVVVSYQ